jgi:hypothetical protein
VRRPRIEESDPSPVPPSFLLFLRDSKPKRGLLLFALLRRLQDRSASPSYRAAAWDGSYTPTTSSPSDGHRRRHLRSLALKAGPARASPSPSPRHSHSVVDTSTTACLNLDAGSSTSSLFVEMDEHPPSILASFTRTLETRVCGRESCRRAYSSCTPQEQRQWDRIENTHNTTGDIRWFCGNCVKHYLNKETTRRQGASLIYLILNFFLNCLLVEPNVPAPRAEANIFQKNVAAAQRGKGMILLLYSAFILLRWIS